MARYTFHIEDPHNDPDKLAEALGVFERLGYPTVECPVLNGRRMRQRRNHLLRAAAALLDASSPWPAAVALAKEIDAFERRVWPIWSEAPPERPMELRRHLFEARRLAGAALPSTARHLYNILKRGGPSNFSSG